MKVSLVVSDLSEGGTLRAFLLAQVLKSLNHTVEIVGFIYGKEIITAPPSGMSIVSVPGKNYPGFLSSAKELLQKLDGDIIYVCKPKPRSFGIGLLKKISGNRPLFLDIDDWELSWHGGYEFKYRPSFKQLYRDIFKQNGALKFPDHPLYVQWMEKLVAMADVVTVDTQFLQQRFGGIYLPNGKDTELFNPDKYNTTASKERYGLSEYRVLMFPGAPRPHKGVEDVLIALDKLNEPDLKLVIVGSNPYDDYDKKLIEKWGHRILKLSKFPVETMPEVLAAADIVVVPQRKNYTTLAQFPLKLTDGMAMAKPILSTKVGDIPEILGDTGYLVEPDSPDEIAEQIKLIFDNLESAKEKARKARERCVEKYSVKAMKPILESVISRF
ncbi:glycosyltransferase [Rivularia sp. PCC 7116]|uniref:glycosyltransferase family 4 protein n=1 Tax=Rivularia sp. PCC 7116 TaxID=373994 RepID=UPI00029F409A|nr:glycosyltransferase family 4 protein [Rivularia sp. PCC 7116]AFY57714.1 glycosyltransferase [Rivularia sp. PCC 7116]